MYTKINHQPTDSVGVNDRDCVSRFVVHLRNYLRQLDTYQKKREAAVLLTEAANKIEMLRTALDDATHRRAEEHRELAEAYHLLHVLSLNMMDDDPTWPRVLKWLCRNEQFRAENKHL